MFSWMHWTLPSAIGFGALGTLILGLAIWDVYSPGFARKGFLPIKTTRGDRVFISIICMIGIFFLWLRFVPEISLYIACLISAFLIFVIMRWG